MDESHEPDAMPGWLLGFVFGMMLWLVAVVTIVLSVAGCCR
jgi:hypothetical protein